MPALDWERILLAWLADSLPLGIVITDTTLVIRACGPWIAQHSGRPMGAIIGQPLHAAFPELEARGMVGHYHEALRGAAIDLPQARIEYLLQFPASIEGLSQMQQAARIAPLRVDGQVVGTLTTITDLSEQVAERAARRRAERDEQFLAQLSTTLADSLDYQSTLDRLARSVVPFLADWCMVEMVGEPGARRVGAVAYDDPRLEATARELHARYAQALEGLGQLSMVLREGKSLLLATIDPEELAASTTNAEQRHLVAALGPASCINVPLRLGETVVGVMILARAAARSHYGPRDLALAEEVARRASAAIANARLYAAAERSRLEAEEALRIRDAFFSIAAHELRTPLTTLLGRVQLLQKWIEQGNPNRERIQRSVQIVVDQAQRLNRMISAMLDISRIRSGRFSIAPTAMDLASLVRRAVDEARATEELHQLTLEVLAEPLLIHGDEARLEQVIQNLIGNAIKYSPAGSRVDVTVERSGTSACLKVRDEGIGIPEGTRELLFRRFYRAENAAQLGVSGLGVGLFVVREIIELHGGTIDVESREGEGSAFTVRLPLSEG